MSTLSGQVAWRWEGERDRETERHAEGETLLNSQEVSFVVLNTNTFMSWKCVSDCITKWDSIWQLRSIGWTMDDSGSEDEKISTVYWTGLMVSDAPSASWFEQADLQTGRAWNTSCSSWKSWLHFLNIYFLVKRHTIVQLLVKCFCMWDFI